MLTWHIIYRAFLKGITVPNQYCTITVLRVDSPTGQLQYYPVVYAFLKMNPHQ